MARVIKGGKADDGKGRTRQSRRVTSPTRRTRPVRAEGPRLLIPVLEAGHEALVRRARETAGLRPCALYLTVVRNLSEGDEAGEAAFAAQIDAAEVLTAAKLLEAQAVLVAHLPAELRGSVEARAAEAGLELIGRDHPIAGKLLDPGT